MNYQPNINKKQRKVSKKVFLWKVSKSFQRSKTGKNMNANDIKISLNMKSKVKLSTKKIIPKRGKTLHDNRGI